MASNRARKIDKHKKFMGNKMMDDIKLFNEINSSPFYDRNNIQHISLMDVANISDSWLQVKQEYLDICEANIFLASRNFGEKNVAERLDIILEYRFQQMQNSFKPVVIQMPAVEETVSVIDYTVSSDEDSIVVDVQCNEEQPPKRSPDMVLPSDTESPVVNNFYNILQTIEEKPQEATVPVQLGHIESHDLGKRRGLIKKSSIPTVFIDSSAKSGTFVKKREKWREELQVIQIPPLIRLLIDDQPKRKQMKRLLNSDQPVEQFQVDSELFMCNNLSQHYHAHNYGGRCWKDSTRQSIDRTSEDKIASSFIANLAHCSLSELIRYKHLIKGYIDGYAAHICYIKKILPFDDKPPWERGMAISTFLLS